MVVDGGLYFYVDDNGSGEAKSVRCGLVGMISASG